MTISQVSSSLCQSYFVSKYLSKSVLNTPHLGSSFSMMRQAVEYVASRRSVRVMPRMWFWGFWRNGWRVKGYLWSGSHWSRHSETQDFQFWPTRYRPPKCEERGRGGLELINWMYQVAIILLSKRREGSNEMDAHTKHRVYCTGHLTTPYSIYSWAFNTHLCVIIILIVITWIIVYLS